MVQSLGRKSWQWIFRIKRFGTMTSVIPLKSNVIFFGIEIIYQFHIRHSDSVLIIWKPDLAWLISFGLAATPLIRFESDVKAQFKKGYITDPFTMMVNCEWNNGGEKNFRNDIWNMLQLIVYSISLGQGK